VAKDGALNEIADMTISCVTRWAGARAALKRGKTVQEVSELDREAGAIVGRFPCAPGVMPSRRQGFSLITHKANRTGKEILAAHIDAWAREIEDLPAPPTTVEDDDNPF
jgi:hypothetical protein